MLLGEGAIERKIFELYLLKYGSSLEKNNIDYAIVDGKIFFPIVLSILKKIGIKTMTLFDLDIETQSVHKYLNDSIRELSTETIFFNSRIEDYLEISGMKLDKYRGETILINEFYLESNPKLFELLSNIDYKIKNANNKLTTEKVKELIHN